MKSAPSNEALEPPDEPVSLVALSHAFPKKSLLSGCNAILHASAIVPIDLQGMPASVFVARILMQLGEKVRMVLPEECQLKPKAVRAARRLMETLNERGSKEAIYALAAARHADRLTEEGFVFVCSALGQDPAIAKNPEEHLPGRATTPRTVSLIRALGKVGVLDRPRGRHKRSWHLVPNDGEKP